MRSGSLSLAACHSAKVITDKLPVILNAAETAAEFIALTPKGSGEKKYRVPIDTGSALK